MKTQLLCIAMLATACTTLDGKSGIRRTHEDRWRDAAERFEADLRERGVADPASTTTPSVATHARTQD